MPIRIGWDRFEVALLFRAYEQVSSGFDLDKEAEKLSRTLRELGARRGVSVDETYRNVNGMKMQLANVQYLFTNGEKGLSGASAIIRQMFELYHSNNSEFRAILQEAIRMIGTFSSVIEEAFFEYAKGKTRLPSRILADYLKKIEGYCHLKQPLLGMTDINAVRNIQQKVAEGKLFKFRFGKDAQAMRDAMQLYYSFVKSYRKPKENDKTPPTTARDDAVVDPARVSIVTHEVQTVGSSMEVPPSAETDHDISETDEVRLSHVASIALPDGQLMVEFNKDSSYLFTKPISYIYKGEQHPAKSWNRTYVEICGLLFADHREAFMGIMNGDVPGYNALSFADEQNHRRMRVPKSFAPGFYLESNQDATSIVKRLRGLHQLFNVGDDLQIIYTKTRDSELSVKSGESDRKWEGDTSRLRRKLDQSFKPFLISEKNLALQTAAQYSQSIEAVEQFIHDKGVGGTLDTTDPDEAQRIIDTLMVRKDFVDWNNMRHHQYSAALVQYVGYLHQGKSAPEEAGAGETITIKDVAVKVLREAEGPLTSSEIMQQIEKRGLYKFNSNNPMLILYQGIRRFCKGMKAPNHAPVDVFDRFTDEAGQIRYFLIDEGPKPEGEIETPELQPIDERWVPILQNSFPDGYILNDFLGQFQAAVFWQERYGSECPIQGDDIDAAMKSVGTIREGRVFAKSEADYRLISEICAEISTILSEYTNVYRICVYERYRDQLASRAIYTEQAMTQQLLDVARGGFISSYQVFILPGRESSVIADCRKVLRAHGGPMSVADVAKVLWFIPHDMVYHCLSVDTESLNIGNSTWMLAEHFPVTKEDADQIGNMLNECFLTKNYVQAFDLIPLLQSRLPSIAENLSGMSYMAVFNIVAYYLRNRFNFTKAIISPKGTSIDFTDLFRAFAEERDSFTLAELEALAGELKLPIYWESTYAGRAVRISKTEFVNKRLIKFDIDAIDNVLADFCPGDYLPLMSVSPAMMMHLPSCGYQWNGYLLQSYVHGFSKIFRLSYSSFGKTGFYGAMVRRSCTSISNYGSLIERVLTDDDTWETPDDALNLLVQRGYQVVRRYRVSKM